MVRGFLFLEKKHVGDIQATANHKVTKKLVSPMGSSINKNR